MILFTYTKGFIMYLQLELESVGLQHG